MRNGVKCYDNFDVYLCFAWPRLVGLLRFPQQEKRRCKPVRHADWPIIVLQSRLPGVANPCIDSLNHRVETLSWLGIMV